MGGRGKTGLAESKKNGIDEGLYEAYRVRKEVCETMSIFYYVDFQTHENK